MAVSLVKPALDYVEASGFNNGLLRCVIDRSEAYVNDEGKVIWRATDKLENGLTPLNIDFMNRGYFYAYSKEDESDIGGFGGSLNISKSVKGMNFFPANRLTVTVRPELPDTCFSRFKGLSVFVANTSGNEVQFNAQDSRLYMKVQALNRAGAWQDIEYLPSSWCGNSYHTLSLEPRQYLKFVTPVYEGEFKTRLRISLEYNDPEKTSGSRDRAKTLEIYSNEYDGSVNPAQFWRKREYSSHGLMDPYND